MVSPKNIKSNLYRETLVDRILDILENRILSGKLPPKTKMSETWVAKEFDVSRVPAREALQRLQEMQLIRKTAWGREVAQFSLEEFREIYELKNVVEAFGAMKGALKATERDRKRIQSVVDRLGELFHSGELEKLRHLNHKFHELMVMCSGNQKLIETYAGLVKQVRWSTPFSLEVPFRPQRSLAEHQAIFEAFKSGKGQEVRALLEAHSQSNMERICSQIEHLEHKEKKFRKEV